MHHLSSRYIPCDGRLTASAYFKSTLPAWGATKTAKIGNTPLLFQSTLPAWGATITISGKNFINQISIHAPRMGSDVRDVQLFLKRLRFQSTLPAWGATLVCYRKSNTKSFQSTLPAWGATLCSCKVLSCTQHFNPRSPHGERHSRQIEYLAH